MIQLMSLLSKIRVGIFFIKGDPGIGKSSLTAQLVKERKYIHHFNIRALGINRPETFLLNICSQLVINYDLGYSVFPPDILVDGRFLAKLFGQVLEKLEKDDKVVIVVDAFDEVDMIGSHSGINSLYLPSKLPDGIFIIITSRRIPLGLRIESKTKELEIAHDSSQNLEDVQEYLEMKTERKGVRHYIETQNLEKRKFIKQIMDKSEGNFMYLRYVLQELEDGYYEDLKFDSLPRGLENYYEDHWRRIGMTMSPIPKEKIKIIYILSEVREPISRHLLSAFSKEDKLTVQGVLEEWIQFLHMQQFGKEKQFSVYHDSFRNFLNRKDIVQAADITIEGINALISDNLWRDLVGNE